MRPVYLLTLRQLSGRGRMAVIAVLAALPVIISALMVGDETSASVADYELGVLSAMLAGSITPLILLAIAAVAFGNELEDRTLANLTISPIPRWQIALPKLLATVTIAAPLIAISAGLAAHIAFLADWTATAAVTISVLVAVLMYASVFVWLGLVTTQAIGIGLLYIVLWEGFFAGFISGVRLFSIRFYAIAIMHGIDDRRFSMYSHVGLVPAIVVAASVIVGFLLLTVRRLRMMDVP